MGEPHFSPWIDALRAPVDTALRRLLGLPDALALSWLCSRTPLKAGGVGIVAVSVQLEPGLTLGLELGDAALMPRAWRDLGRLRVAYRAAVDGDALEHPRVGPVLSALARRLEAVVAQRPALIDDLAEALAALRPYGGVEDWMFRQLSWSVSGQPYGRLRLGFRCNQNCDICWQDRRWGEPDPAWYHRWLDELATAGATELHLTGGEPTLHAGLPALVRRAARDHGMLVTLQTNAIRLARPEVLGPLMDAGAAMAFVSLHSADPEVSDAITRTPGTFWRTVAGIEAALAAGLVVTLNAVVERRNAPGLVALAHFVVERFVRPFPDNPVRSLCLSQPSTYFDAAPYDEALVPFDTLAPALQEATALLGEAGVLCQAVGSCGYPPCLLPEHPEVHLPFEREASDAVDRQSRRFAPVCEGCAARPSCPGVRDEYLRRFGDRGLRPMPDPVDGAAFMATMAAIRAAGEAVRDAER